MDRPALERLDHHVVSRRVDLALATAPTWPTVCSSPYAPWPTSSTACARPAPAPTPCWRTSWPGRPAASTPSWRAGNPPKLVPTLRRSTTLPCQGYALRPIQRPVAGVHGGVVAGATAAHHRPPRQTTRNVGRRGRRPRPARRLARTGLAPRGHLAPESPSGVLPLAGWTRSFDQLSGHMPDARYLASQVLLATRMITAAIGVVTRAAVVDDRTAPRGSASWGALWSPAPLGVLPLPRRHDHQSRPSVR